MIQVWAEVYTIWEMGEQTYLTNNEFNELNIHNIKHETIKSFRRVIIHFL